MSKYKLNYQAHIAGRGWQNKVNEGEIAGTVGESTQMECYRVFLESDDGSGIHAFAKPNGMNWSNGNIQGEDVGTTGLGVALEAIKIGLTGPIAETHDIWYSVHVSNVGFMGWNKNGQVVGTEGSNGKNRIEAIQIRLAPKGKAWFGVDDVASYKNVTPPAPPEETEDSKRVRIIERARSYLGYVSGTSDDSQFGRRFCGPFAGSWCAYFVMGVFQDEGLSKAIPFYGYCPTIVYEAKQQGTWHSVNSGYVPKTGDLVLYDFNYNDVSDHIGIVETTINPSHVIAIEGNTGSPVGVYRKDRSYGILGYVTPKF